MSLSTRGYAAPLLAALVVVSLSACGGSPDSPSPTRWTQPDTALLSASGSGVVKCTDFPMGCVAFLLIKPAGWDPKDWQPSWEEPSFDKDPLTGRIVSGPAPLPPTIAPGQYTLAGAYADLSDEARSPGEEARLYDSEVMCTASLTVEPATASVSVQVVFTSLESDTAWGGGNSCRLDVMVTPAPHEPSGS